MIGVLPGIRAIKFRERFGRDTLELQGEEHGPLLDDEIRALPDGSVIAFDLRGLRYLGYSYAKATIRAALLRRNRGEYGNRRLMVIANQGREFLDGIIRALRDEKLFMAVARSLEEVEKRAELIGDVPEYIQETFTHLARTAPITTGGLARALGESPQNTKNRLDRLERMGLLQREKVASPSGGLEWLNWVF